MVERYKTSAPLIYWAVEREKIRLNKLLNKPQELWTSDPILAKYRFCNVRRQHDRVSQWLLLNVLNFCGEFDSQYTFIQWVALCRWVNWPPTLGAILADGGGDLVTYDQIDLKRIGAFIDGLTTKGKTWTGAYMVRAPSKAKYPGVGKGQFVAETVVGALRDQQVFAHMMLALGSKKAEEVWKVLYSVPNWGTFMAGQVVADLTYCSLLEDAPDLNTWAPQGPGSRRGFNRLLGRALCNKIDPSEWSDRLQGWRQDLIAEYSDFSSLTLMDVQNCLCEVDKYLRVKAGEGRPRSTYKPETAY
jgi:hypothetical protein